MSRRLFLSAMIAGILSFAAACQSDPQLERPETVEGESFGEKLFTLTCQRIAYSSSLEARLADDSRPVDVSGSRYRLACRYGPEHLDQELAAREDPAVLALFGGRQPFIEAANRIFPGGELEQLQRYMERVLPLTDDGRFPALVEAGRKALAIAAENEPALSALASMQRREGYRPRDVCLGALREALTYPELPELLSAALRFGGEGGIGQQALLKSAQAASFELRDVRRADDPNALPPMHPSDPRRPMTLLSDLLLAEHSDLGGAQPRYMVRRDWRGVARVSRISAPFADVDGDGLADIDGRGGFTTSDGVSAPAPFHLDPQRPDPAPARDAHGRALDSAGEPLFDYVDLDRTLLAALMRQGARLVSAPGDMLSLLQDGARLGGPRVHVEMVAKDGSVHSAQIFDVARSPLLDLSHAIFAGLADPNLPALLGAAKALLKDEPAIAALVRGLDEARLTLRAHPERERVAESNFFDELILLLREISRRPGLIEDLLAALRDPRSGNVGPMLANYFHYRDVHVLDPASDEVRNESSGRGIFAAPVDRSLPDTGMNRSIKQRLWHMIHDANGMRLCNKQGARIEIPLVCDIPGVGWLLGCSDTYDQCELFEIENGAVFYLQAMAGKAHMRLKTENMPSVVAAAIDTIGADFVLEMMTGVEGMTEHPTPQAINRYLFMTEMPPMLAAVQDLPRDKDGDLVHQSHRGTLFSWGVKHPGMSCRDDDACTFFQAFRPIAEAFARHDAEKTFIDLLSLLHRHWPSAQSADHQFTNAQQREFAHGTGIKHAEPLFVDLLTNTSLWDALRRVALASGKIKGARGASLDTLLARSARYWLDPELSPELRYRDGRASATFADGVTPVPDGLAPINLAVDALRSASDLLDEGAQAVKRREEAVDGIFVALLATEADPVAGDGTLRMVDRALLPSITLMTDFVQRRIEDHDPSCVDSGDCADDGRCSLDSGRCTTAHLQSDRARWLQQELPRHAERFVGSPLLPAGADLVALLRQDDGAREAIRRVVSYLLDERISAPSFAATLTTVGDALQLLQDDRHMVPLLNLFGRLLGADVGITEQALRFLGPAVAADDDAVFSRLLGNAVEEQTPGRSPLEVLVELAKQVNRIDPLAQVSYEAGDFRSALKALERFLGDPERGVVKFFELIRNRCGGSCR